MMTQPSHNPHLFWWRTRGKSRPIPADKNGDIDQWRKRVEKASEFAVSEVFSHKKPHSRTNSLTVALQSSDQLRDHDNAYSEAQALLSDWMSSKLRLELEMDAEDDLICSAESRNPAALPGPQSDTLTHDNFDDLYKCLTEEEEHSAVNSFLQDLVEREVLDSGMAAELALDFGQTRKKFRDPIVTMEARHHRVRENRARREAERQRQQRERASQLGAREEAKRREQEEEMRKKQEAHRQEELLQQEMVRLRRQQEERRSLEQLVKQREKERQQTKGAARSLQTASVLPRKKQQQDTDGLYKEQKIQTKIHMNNLKCLQRHFSGWYSVLLDRRIRMGKVMALCDWKTKLRAWRVWRGVVWAAQRQREVVKTAEELRAENRQCQVAVESDRKRLLRRCLQEWHLWSRIEGEQRELLVKQQETRRKMAALISSALTGKIQATQSPVSRPVMAPRETPNLADTTGKEGHHTPRNVTTNTSTLHQVETTVGAVAEPTQPWQVTRRHVAPTAAELHVVWHRGEGGGIQCAKLAVSPGGRFENRHAVQQQIITQQRKLLKEQQEQIAKLKEERSMMGLELEMEKTAQLTRSSVRESSRPRTQNINPTEQRAERATGEADSLCTPPRKAVTRQTCPHPIITAMEARAQQRAERRKEIEELKRKKEEEKLAEMKAAEKQRKREEEEEKRKATEKKREEKRLEREREEQKQKQHKKHQELLKLSRQHHRRTLLLRRGLIPWKRLIQLTQANVQLAERHHNLILLRRCTLGWQQSARESTAEKEASADQLHQHFLLRRSLSCWRRLKDWRAILETRAERFYRSHTIRRFLLALLDHVTEEKLVEWDRLELAQEHSNRRVLQRCFLTWRQLPCQLRKEREREARREKLGRKVAEVLPDFCSNPL